MFSVPKISQRKVTIFLHGYRCRYIKAALHKPGPPSRSYYANPYICKGLSSTKIIPDLRPHTDAFISVSFQFLQQTGLIQINTLLSIYLSVFIQEIHMKCMELSSSVSAARIRLSKSSTTFVYSETFGVPFCTST